ncbi:MAG: UDP-N-acetylmuramoyl-L-alanine--D-glutamate ligase [Methylococcales bacterium]|nr:UDP-N-acetylmuramoyl-L-alanine--D-glutamate ligase [Methylococcales bacterium]
MNRTAILKSLNKQLSLTESSKVLIVGLGATGFSVAKYLQQLGIKFAIVDSRDKPPLNDALLQDYPDTPVFTGGFDKAAFDVATHLVVSPGVSLQEEVIRKAIFSAAILVSDIDLFACSTMKPIVAITGSNGKSTVTTMLGEMAKASGIETAIGGNLGVPALDLLDEKIELYVIELSSFQLERTSVLGAKVATVLNVSADHLDRHADIESYAKEKQSIFSANSVMVLNEDDVLVKAMEREGSEVLTFTLKGKNGFHIETQNEQEWLMNAQQALMRKSELPLEGLHNTANALAALALGTAIGLNVKAMCNVLREFKGLNHRMQKVAKIKGVTWVNDSKATNIGACIAALKGYQHKVVLIAGGDAKGADMGELISIINNKARCVILMGKDADKIEQALNNSIPSYRAATVKEAVEIAAKLALEGESVLLSPACASIDQYKNYQERGDKFTAAVMSLAA